MNDIMSSYIDQQVSHSNGIGVTFLRAMLDGKFMPEYSYHLHFIFTQNKEADRINVLCLDTGINTTIINYSLLDDLDSSLNDAMISLSESFVDLIYQGLIRGNMTKDYLFCRQDQKLWDRFNQIKEQSFIQNMNNLSTTLQNKPEPVQKEKDCSEIIFTISIEDKAYVELAA